MHRAARNRHGVDPPTSAGFGRWLVGVVLALLAPSPAAGQFGDEIPHGSYYLATNAFYAGEYRDAERELRRETQRGVRTAQARWIDGICYHAMLGEVLYHEGRNAEALAEFDQACHLLLAYPDWMLRLKPEPLRANANLARRSPPWGPSERRLMFSDIPRTMQIAIGQLDNRQALQQGGVVVQAQYWRINATEIVRASALAIRRRSELLGPLAPHDRISRELSDVFSRGNLAPPNHWLGAWVDLLRGITQAGIGKLDEADQLIGRSVVIEGQYDHPLTCVALMEQGRLAMIRGDSRRAASLLAEAGFSAYYYENWDALTESLLLGWLNHLTSGGAGVYPPLESAAAWAHVNRWQHVATKLRLAQAESLLWLGQVDSAAALLADTSRRLGEMRAGLPGIHQLFLQANVQIAQGQMGPGGEILAQALAAQAAASLRNFQIARTGEMYDARAVPARVAVEVYASLLADPPPTDWAFRPLDSMAVLQTSQDGAFDRWFLAALERKEAPLALEVAEQAKRRRFLASLPLGGRLLALRTILEAQANDLSRDAVLQRQQLLAIAPAYRELSDAGSRLYDQLRAGPILTDDATQTKSLAALYDNWAKNVGQRQQLLMQLASRRVPSAIEFPPIRKVTELQQTLGDGEALVLFHSAAGNLYGFLITQKDAHLWQLSDVRRLRSTLGDLLRGLGNYGANRTLSVAELQNDRWRESAAKAYEAVFADARLDLAKTTAMIVVPDDVLWHLPFEVLIPAGAKPEGVLADRVPIRYGPTAALAVADGRSLRRPQHTGIVASQLDVAGDAEGAEQMFQELEKMVSGPLRLPVPLPEPAHLVAPLLDELIVFDDVETDRATGYGWSPLPRARGAADGTAGTWVTLPYGGPQRIVLAGFTTEAEQGLKSTRHGAGRDARPGGEVFQTLCGLMANGARTILLSRWRTGGRTNFDLVREFARELPNTPAAEAWRRACVLAREAPLNVEHEPRLKRSDEAGELPTADHPFFWAGYLVVDTSPQPEKEQQREPNKELDVGQGGGANDKNKAPSADPAGSDPDDDSALKAHASGDDVGRSAVSGTSVDSRKP